MAAAAILLSNQGDAIIKHLEQQQQYLDILDEILNIIETITLQTVQAPKYFRQGSPSFEMKGRGRNTYTDRRGDLGGRSLPPQSRLRGKPLHQRPLSKPRLMHPQQEQGTAKSYTDNQCWQCREVGHLKRSCTMLKRQETVSRRVYMNSAINTHSHSPCISTKSSTLGGKNVTRESNRNPQRNTLNPDYWTKLIGRSMRR